MSTAISNESQTASSFDDDDIHVGLVPAYQTLYELQDDPRVRHFFMWGGRGSAKSLSMADFFALRAREERGVFLCVREVQNSIAESVYGSIKTSIEELEIPGYYMTEVSIVHEAGATIRFAGLSTKTASNIKSKVAIRRCWCEEAQQLTRKSLDLLIPTIRAKRSKLYYTFNRELPKDAIYELFLEFNCKTETRIYEDPETGREFPWRFHWSPEAIGIEIQHDGNPYFPEVLEAERARSERVAKQSGNWGHHNHIWRGQPAPEMMGAVIGLREVVEAQLRSIDPDGAEEIGADIARGGKDRVVFCRRKGLKVTGFAQWRNQERGEKMRITQTAERLMSFAGDDKKIRIKVDDTGLGGGVTDILEDHGYNVVPVNFAQKAVDEDHYANASSEMWFDFAQTVADVDLPDDRELEEELIGRLEGRRDRKGRRTVEPKDEYIKRLGRSPDKADAMLLAYYEPGNVISSVGWSIS